MTINWFNQNELKRSPFKIGIRIKMIKASYCLLQVRFSFIQIIKTNLINSVQFQIDWNPNKCLPKHTVLGHKRSVRWKIKESETLTTSSSPWMYLAKTMAGWNSIQGISIQGRAPLSYPFSSLCKNYEKNYVWFSSHPKFKQNTHFSLFSFLVGKNLGGGKCWQKKKKISSQGKNKYYKFPCSLNLFTCMRACIHTHYIFL